MLYYNLVIENNIYKAQRVNDRGYRDNKKNNKDFIKQDLMNGL